MKVLKNHAGRLQNNPFIIVVSVIGPVRKMTSLIKKSKSISKKEEGVVGKTLVVISTRKPERKIHDQNKFSFSSELGQVTFFTCKLLSFIQFS